MKPASNRGAGADRIVLLLFGLAILAYLPGIWWGLPAAVASDRVMPWGSDELAPVGPLAQMVSVVLHGDSPFDPRYPLLPYLLQSLFIAPYAAFRWLTGGFAGMTATFPYGLTNPVRDLAAMTLAGRLSSLIAAATLPAIAFMTVRRLADRYTAMIAGTFTLLLYPLFYYARTSNVDAAALAFVALGLMAFAGVLRDGLTARHAAALGVFAALAVATKDQNYAIFVAIGIAALFIHFTSRPVRPGAGSSLREPAIGLVTALAVYGLASGLLVNPAAFVSHVNFIVFHPAGGGSGQSYFSTPATPAGYASLVLRYAGHIIDSMGVPMVLAAAAGLVVVARRDRRLLFLCLPVVVVFLGVVAPVRFVRIRFVLPTAYVLALFAAFAVAALAGRSTTDEERETPTAARRRFATACLAVIIGWGALRGADLTWQMLSDSRLVMADWLEANARPGDTVGYYGAALKLPHLPPDVRIEEGPYGEAGDRPSDASWPEFIVIIPQQPFESEHEWNLPEARYQELLNGQWDYDPFIAYQSPSLFARRPINWVNPPVRLFVRRDVIPRLVEPVRRLELD